MDHPCPSCGLAVANGTPFCSGCRAPQIRFVAPEPAPSPAHTDAAVSETPSVSTPLAWGPACRAALVGAVLSILSTQLPSALLGFGFMAGGVLAVYSYRRRVPGASLNLGSGALLGAVSGLFGSLFLDVVAALRILLSHDRDELRKTAFAALDKVVQSTDPQLQESGQQFLRSFNTPGGFITLMVIGAVVACAMFIFFSVLGGAIGANITRQNQKSGPKAH